MEQQNKEVTIDLTGSKTAYNITSSKSHPNHTKSITQQGNRKNTYITRKATANDQGTLFDLTLIT